MTSQYSLLSAKSTKEYMKYIVSVSKKHNSVYRIYYYDFDDDDNLVFMSKRISKWLVPFYKLAKCHRTKMICTDCSMPFLSITRRPNPKYDDCPYCD